MLSTLFIFPYASVNLPLVCGAHDHWSDIMNEFEFKVNNNDNCEANPFSISVESPMPRCAAIRVMHKPGMPTDAQGYGLWDEGG